MVEQLATMGYYEYLSGIPVENITWIEYYPPEPETGRKVTFDRIIMNCKEFNTPQMGNN